MTTLLLEKAFALLLLLLCLLAAQPGLAQDDYRQNYSPEYKEYVGSYELEPNRFIIIGRAFRGTLYYADTVTGRFGKIDPAPTNTFSDKQDTEVKFERDAAGSIKGLHWSQGGSTKVFAKKLGLRAEEVRFQNGNVLLSGTLILPPKKGRHPIVIIHLGSDWKIREDFIEDCYRMASYGIGAFCYDKRGWGNSTGDRSVSFEVTALDAVTAVKALQQNSNVNPKQIGLWGYSQTGWIMPLAASLSKDVAFLHLIAAPYTLPFRQELQRLEYSLRADGFPEAEIAQALNLMKLKIEYARTGKGWDEYFAARQKAQGQKWDRGAGGPETKDSEDWQWMKMNFFYNPLPALEKITAPVLSLHAEKDTSVLPEVNKSILEMALEKAGNRDYTIKTIPNANHQFLDTVTAGDGRPGVRRYAPGFYETIIEWTKERVDVVK